jgi:hypothetical protein
MRMPETVALARRYDGQAGVQLTQQPWCDRPLAAMMGDHDSIDRGDVVAGQLVRLSITRKKQAQIADPDHADDGPGVQFVATGRAVAKKPRCRPMHHRDRLLGTEQTDLDPSDAEDHAGLGQDVSAPTRFELVSQLQVAARLPRTWRHDCLDARRRRHQTGAVYDHLHLQVFNTLQQTRKMIGMGMRDHQEIDLGDPQGAELLFQTTARRTRIE